MTDKAPLVSIMKMADAVTDTKYFSCNTQVSFVSFTILF